MPLVLPLQVKQLPVATTLPVAVQSSPTVHEDHMLVLVHQCVGTNDHLAIVEISAQLFHPFGSPADYIETQIDHDVVGSSHLLQSEPGQSLVVEGPQLAIAGRPFLPPVENFVPEPNNFSSFTYHIVPGNQALLGQHLAVVDDRHSQSGDGFGSIDRLQVLPGAKGTHLRQFVSCLHRSFAFNSGQRDFLEQLSPLGKIGVRKTGIGLF